MIDRDWLQNVVDEHLAGTDMFAVEVRVNTGNVLLVEIDSDTSVSLDDCIALNRKIESLLNRDEEDFELEVGSAGITSPLRLPRQYKKNIGNTVEVLSKDGRKLYGVLKSANENGFTLTITKKEKPEGAKRKIEVEEDLVFAYGDVKHTKYQIKI